MTTTTQIAEYSQYEAAIATLREQYGATVWVADTPERMKAAKAARKEVRGWRTELETLRKKIKAPALKRCKDIDGDAKRIEAELLEIETPIDAAIKEVEQQKKAEEEAKKRAEEERLAKHRAVIDRLRNLPVECIGKPSAFIQEKLDAMAGFNFATLEEFAGVAMTARDDTVAKLKELKESIETQERERMRLEAERAEIERKRVEQDMRDREAAERRAEEDRIAREARDKAEREAREVREKADAEARKARAEQEEKIRKERAELEAKREIERAKEREEQRKRDQLLDGRAMLKSFAERFGKLPEFEEMAELILAFLAETNE